MKNWILYWLGAVFLIVVVCIAIIIKTLFLSNYNKTEYNNNEYLYSTFDERHELIQKVCEKNGNWNKLFVSNKFRNKYNEKDGYFGKTLFDKVEVQPYEENEYSFAFYPHIVLTEGLKKTVYVCQYKYSSDEKDPGLEDIIVNYKLQLTDENGNNLDARTVFADDLKKENIDNLILNNELASGVAVTEHFKEKYPYFLDIFIHYSPLSYNRISYIDSESDLKNNIAIFRVNSILECKRRKYRVKLILDKNLYLDDVEVELLDTEEYRGNNQNTTLKLLYKNSNWDNIEITDKYRNKYKGNSYIEDIDNINIDLFSESIKVDNNKYIRKYQNNDNSYSFYYIKFNITVDDKIDDIYCQKLDYDSSMTIEEAKEKYINENKK